MVQETSKTLLACAQKKRPPEGLTHLSNPNKILKKKKYFCYTTRMMNSKGNRILASKTEKRVGRCRIPLQWVSVCVSLSLFASKNWQSLLTNVFSGLSQFMFFSILESINLSGSIYGVGCCKLHFRARLRLFSPPLENNQEILMNSVQGSWMCTFLSLQNGKFIIDFYRKVVITVWFLLGIGMWFCH